MTSESLGPHLHIYAEKRLLEIILLNLNFPLKVSHPSVNTSFINTFYFIDVTKNVHLETLCSTLQISPLNVNSAFQCCHPGLTLNAGNTSQAVLILKLFQKRGIL